MIVIQRRAMTPGSKRHRVAFCVYFEDRIDITYQ